jgi:hypothetical protein
MTRQDAAAFTRGVMDRIRESSGITGDCGWSDDDEALVWKRTVPGAEYVFMVMPHGRLVLRINGRGPQQVAWVRKASEAKIFIEHFLRGVDLSPEDIKMLEDAG